MRAGWPEDRGKRFPAGGGKTALAYAAREGHLDVTRLLVERGANLELADGNGVTPLIGAILNASIFPRESRGHAATIWPSRTLLLDAGANVNAMDWYGETPLWAAVDLRNLELGPADNDHGHSRRGVRADRALARSRREPERAHARVSARAPLSSSPSWAPSRGSTSRDRRRSCAPRPPAICA